MKRFLIAVIAGITKLESNLTKVNQIIKVKPTIAQEFSFKLRVNLLFLQFEFSRIWKF